jgi:hypothetical protein
LNARPGSALLGESLSANLADRDMKKIRVVDDLLLSLLFDVISI